MARLLHRSLIVEAPRPADHPPARSHRTHPGAWWVWAIGAAVVASISSGLPPVLLTTGVVLVVVRIRRPEGRMQPFVLLAAFIVLARLCFRVLFGGPANGTVVFRLPELPLPSWAAGIQLGGPVTAEELAWTFHDASRLGTVVVAIGAASVLAEPRTTLRCVPAALHDVSAALVITLSVLPQILQAALRVKRARRLRGHSGRGFRAVTPLVVPVLEEAVEGSMNLASSMEARGYGRTRDSRPVGAATTITLLGSLVCLILGAFVLLGIPLAPSRVLGLAPQQWLAVALLGLGTVAGGTALALAGRRLSVTRHRPTPWGGHARFLVVSSGAAALAASLPGLWALLAPLLLSTALWGKERA